MILIKILKKEFFARDTVMVAKELIGKFLVREHDGIKLVGMIVQTEAYRSTDDPACHAHKGKTNRNAALFGPVGHAYVYFTYGCHFCMNVVARDDLTKAGGVLIRAIEPSEGIETMQKLRGKVPFKNVANGPGKLTQALAINRTFDGTSLLQHGSLYLAEPKELYSFQIKVTPRIGISRAQDKLWRFIVDNKSAKMKK